MSFLLKSKPKRNYNSAIVAVVALFLILFLLSFLFPNFIRSTSFLSMRPFWLLKEKTLNSIYYTGNFFVLKSSLIKENSRLNDELTLLRLTKIDHEILLKENQELKENLGINTNERVVGNILSKPPFSPFDTFVINIGLDHGVGLGNKVYISDSIILGIISNVTKNTSIVKLFSSSAEVSGAVSSRTGATYSLKGNGGANFQIEVPRETDILWGDTFLYPGRTDSVLAVVYFVDSSSQSSFKTINLRIPGNAFQAKSVFVEK